ncbi:hypothetical protein TI04_02800 [Achromatium sp. WMS2]|nr:hypothetical protein TI04_02800 [Achromatium sp. WMS2]
MSRIWKLMGGASKVWDPEVVATVYQAAFNWPDGRRLPDESRAVQLTCDLALRQAGINPARSLGADYGIVLTGTYGGRISYESFQKGISNTQQPTLQPLAFAFSLPGTPASVLSLYYGVSGPVVSLDECESDSGLRSLIVALGLLESGTCQKVIVGSFYYPSQTARNCGSLGQAKVTIGIIVDDSEIISNTSGNMLLALEQPTGDYNFIHDTCPQECWPILLNSGPAACICWDLALTGQKLYVWKNN